MQSERHQGGRNAPTMSDPHPKFRRKRQLGGKLSKRKSENAITSWPKEKAFTYDRESALADIAAYGDEDNAEAAAADLAREFPHSLRKAAGCPQPAAST